ncbi:hypothetical protein DKP76_07285 [Falsochrobactrum shanghaiense]|uniref:Uncharacterized protein n=1 Tax=Falsochrobactrum shanghaiense TaxID=2201899 RepID=A0A316JA61_9HYPH|nr:hypothetical protein [Falsochrobactrum shanghaiense]PWL18857.1 hypothetical protein DKP76_07285 [Falsochrobactrum shanghaiense]
MINPYKDYAVNDRPGNTRRNSPWSKYRVEDDRILIQPGRIPGGGRVGRSLAHAALALVLAFVAMGVVFWNGILPFYGLLYLWGG